MSDVPAAYRAGKGSVLDVDRNFYDSLTELNTRRELVGNPYRTPAGRAGLDSTCRPYFPGEDHGRPSGWRFQYVESKQPERAHVGFPYPAVAKGPRQYL